ncbi:RIP metalloprotease RseP [Candidatus Soleaferrea massiliensis]|uniref:RIP metalloprotease RseP n=1 Tax=Candidatus Soleaferrea massiliensis TaxID=1470354 RepID=UPI000590CB0A|nr:RIP metalloprotease RseP [Candidatus Soleaferrea massiliensis]
MSVVWTVLIAVLVFAALIFIHELGHFLMAKLNGIKVDEFALGMGPTLLKWGKGETTYALRLFPIGGFCKMEGEDEGSLNERAFCNKKVWRRILVVVAGALTNIVLGFIILLCLTSSQDLIGSTQVAKFNEGSISQNSGLQAGDIIERINGNKTNIDYDILYALMRDKDGVVDMEVLRGDEIVKLDAVKFNMQELEDGTKTIQLDFKVKGEEKTFLNVVHHSFFWTGAIIKVVWTSLLDLITGNFGFNQLSGPVGVATAIGQASSMGLSSLFLMIAFITINLGVFNLLPFPALDGGRLVFLIIEGIRRKPIKPEYEGYVHLAGLLLLFLLMIAVTFNDIARLITGG